MTILRLQKVLAAAGIASRRHAETMISAGRVAVNGRVVRSLGSKADPASDTIAVDGRRISILERKRYLLLNKPAGVLTTVTDPQGRQTVIDLVGGKATDDEGNDHRIFPIGRLDLDSEGLLLLTDDGELTHRVTHPSVELDKEYRVLARGRITEEKLNKLRAGVYLNGRKTAPAQVSVEIQPGPDTTWLRFIIHEGRKRQVRRMCLTVDLDVVRLVRVRIGPLDLGSLKSGQVRDLTDEETRDLRQAVGLTAEPESLLIPSPAGGPDHEAAAYHRHRRSERRR